MAAPTPAPAKKDINHRNCHTCGHYYEPLNGRTPNCLAAQIHEVGAWIRNNRVGVDEATWKRERKHPCPETARECPRWVPKPEAARQLLSSVDGIVSAVERFFPAGAVPPRIREAIEAYQARREAM